MTPDYRVGVTSVDSYQYFQRTPSMEFREHLTRLLRLTPPTDAVLRGRKFHQMLEDFIVRKQPLPRHNPFSDGTFYVPRQDAMEVPVKRMFEYEGERVLLSGRMDAVRGLTVSDFKTTGRTIDLESYGDTFQWRAYLAMYPVARHFKYEVFQLRRENIVDHRYVLLHRYPGLERDVEDQLWEYCRHLRELHDAGWIRLVDGRPKIGWLYMRDATDDEVSDLYDRFIKSKPDLPDANLGLNEQAIIREAKSRAMRGLPGEDGKP